MVWDMKDVTDMNSAPWPFKSRAYLVIIADLWTDLGADLFQVDLGAAANLKIYLHLFQVDLWAVDGIATQQDQEDGVATQVVVEQLDLQDQSCNEESSKIFGKAN